MKLNTESYISCHS